MHSQSVVLAINRRTPVGSEEGIILARLAVCGHWREAWVGSGPSCGLYLDGQARHGELRLLTRIGPGLGPGMRLGYRGAASRTCASTMKRAVDKSHPVAGPSHDSAPEVAVRAGAGEHRSGLKAG